MHLLRKMCGLHQHRIPRMRRDHQLLFCHSDSGNHPQYQPLLESIQNRREEAQRSILVQVKGYSSAENLYSYCSQHFGKVAGLHYYNNVGSKSFSDFFVVEFCQPEAVFSVLSSASHCPHESPPVPVYSPFLWFSADKSNSPAPMLSEPAPVFPPQLIAKSKGGKKANTLSEQIRDLWQEEMISDINYRVRFLVCRQVELALSGMFPRAAVLPFGSSVNGFGKVQGDQDMVLVLDPAPQLQETKQESRLKFHAKSSAYGGDRAQVRRYCDEVSNIIQMFLPGCQDVQKILYARVPIIKYRQELVGLDCDLSMTSSSGLHMSCLLHLWGGIDSRVRPLVAIIRRWARSQRLVKDVRPTNYLTNFVLTLLVITYLQQQHKMLPTLAKLQQMATDKDSYTCEDGVTVKFLRDIGLHKEELNACYHSSITLFDLLEGFYTFYQSYNFAAKSLCPITGQSIAKDKFWSKSSAMDIINPLESDLNVSYNVSLSAARLFKDKCAEAAKKCRQLRKQEAGGQPPGRGILTLLGQEEVEKSFSIPKIQELGLRPNTAERESTRPVAKPTVLPTTAKEDQRLDVNLGSLLRPGGGKTKAARRESSETVTGNPGGSKQFTSASQQQAAESRLSEEQESARIEMLKRKYLRAPDFNPVFKQKL